MADPVPQGQDDLSALDAYLGINRNPAPPAPEPEGLFGRIGKQAANLPGNVATDLIQGYQGAINLLSPGEVEPTKVPDMFNIAPPQTFGQKAVDVGSNLAAMIPALMAPETAVSEGAELFGAGKTLARTIGAAAGWGLSGTPEGGTETGVQAGLGALNSLAMEAPAKYRVALAGLSGLAGYEAGARQSTTQGIVMGGMNALLPFVDPALRSIFGRNAEVNQAGALEDGASKVGAPAGPQGPQPIPRFDTSAALLQPQPYGDLSNLDVFQRNPLPPPDVSGFPQPGNVPSSPPEPLRLAQDSQAQPQSNGGGGLSFFNPPDQNGLHLVPGQRGVEFPGWEQGEVPLQPQQPLLPQRRIMPGTSFDSDAFSRMQTGEQAYGGQPGLFDVMSEGGGMRRSEPSLPEVATLQNEINVPDEPAQQHPLEQLSPKQQKLMQDNGLGAPGEMPPATLTGTAHAMAENLGSVSDLNQIKNASKKISQMVQDGMTSGMDPDVMRELTAKGQVLKEAVEYAEGNPAKMDTYRRLDPDYEPKFPSKGYKDWQARGGFNLPKAGENHVLWSDDGMPLPVTVTKATKGKINYVQTDIMGGGLEEHKTATPQEFATLQKHPSQRGVEAPPNPPEPVGPAATPTPTTTTKPTPEDYHTLANTTKGSDITNLANKYGVSKEVQDKGWNEMGQDWLRSQIKEKMDNATLQTAPESQPSSLQKPVSFVQNGERINATLHEVDEGGVGRVTYDDPARGELTKFIDIKELGDPVGEVKPIEGGGGVPFQDIKGSTTFKSGAEGDWDDIDQIIRGNAAPDKFIIGEDGQKIPLHEIPDIGDDLTQYMQKYKSQTIGQASKDLSGLGGLVMKDLFQRILKAAGKAEFPVRIINDDDLTRIGLMDPVSGRVELGYDNIRRTLQDWPKMNPMERAQAMVQLTKLLGHEVSHAAIAVGKALGLTVNGRNIVDAIENEVFSLPLSTRQFIAGELKEATGEIGIVSNYLAGDINTVWQHYSGKIEGLTKLQAQKMAAEEFMVEWMSAELHKRMEMNGLTGIMRAAVDRLKNAVKGVFQYFSKTKSTVATLQNLSDLSNTILNRFGEATDAEMQRAFPASKFWGDRADKSYWAKMNEVPTGFKEPTNPMDWIVMDRAAGSPAPPMPQSSEAFLKNELVRLGIRTAIGGVVGGLVAPTVSKNQITTAEGVLAGGVLAAFGPMVAKRILNSDIATDVARAVKAGGGNPIKTLSAIFDNKPLRDLGGQALFDTRTGVAQMVRWMEVGFGVNFDPKLKNILINARGLGSEQLATMFDALRKFKDAPVSEGVRTSALDYLTGKIDQDAFTNALGTQDEKAYGTLVTTARSGIDNLQTMLASGMQTSAFKTQVENSVGSYLGKFYKAYTEGTFNMDAFAKAKADMKAAFPDYADNVIESQLYQHMREVQSQRTLFGNVGGGAEKQAMASSLWNRRLATESEIEAQQAIVSGMDKSDPDFKAANDKLNWMQAHPITPGYAEWLGEISDPKERALRTFQKLYASSIASKSFDLMSTSRSEFGLKFAYGAEELSREQEAIAGRLKSMTPDDPSFATLQRQQKELGYYVPLPSGAQYGKLSGKMVNRFVRDEVSTNTSPFQFMEQPVFRAIAGFNGMIKMGRSALNPLTVIRNYLQMPMFGLMAKTNMTDMVSAWQHISKGTELGQLMLRRGISDSSVSMAELTDGPGKIFSGMFDSDAAKRLASEGMDKALQIYGAPDQVVRGGAFISALKRFGNGDLNAALANPDIVDRAVDFTNRYTMNYSVVPKIVKVGRQLPFVSLYLSYTSEITRLLKNFTQDIINPGADSAGRMHAIGVMGAMAAVPALLTAAGENSLSPKDKAAWDQIRNLSPDDTKERFRVPIGKNPKTGAFHYFDITNLLPADDFSQMIRGVANGDWKAVAANNPIIDLENTPLLNIASEQIAGKDLNTGKDFTGMLDRGRAILKEILPPLTPGVGYEAQRIQNAFTPNQNGGLGLTEMRTGRSIMPSDIVANYLTAMKFGDVSLGAVQRNFVADAKQQIAEQQQLLRQTTASDANANQKGVAVDRFNNAVQQIVFKMHEKLDAYQNMQQQQ